MPKSRDALSRHVVFPPDNPTGECDEWCAPLHQVNERIQHHPHAVFFDVDDFMVMSGWRRPGRSLLILYKHVHTRHYLNVDAVGDVWRYVAPRKGSDQLPGAYRRLASVDEALVRLGLEEMPWMDPERFGHLQDAEPWQEMYAIDRYWETGSG